MHRLKRISIIFSTVEIQNGLFEDNYVLNKIKLENPFNFLRENARFYSYILDLQASKSRLDLVEEYSS